MSSTPNRGVRLELTHADDRGGYAGAERVRRAADRTHRRVNGLLGSVDEPSTGKLRSDGAAANVHASTATYLVDVAIGTPPPPPAAAVDVPRLVLHFDGADMELPRESYVVEDPSAGVLCLGMVSARGMSVLGSMQQQNMHVLYDLRRGLLSFEPAKCGDL
uniref:Peptidase A1 domain-containing protein n=1 Tax=Oryza brachyantha TaxID=4533 RepID=J3MLK7_ORYBR